MRILVKPAAGKTVRDPRYPERGYIEPAGRIVEDTPQWRRLANAGDVTIEPEPAEPTAVAAKPAPKAAKQS